MSIRKLLAASLALVMACSMCVGCGSGSSETEGETVAPAVTPSGEKIETDYGVVTLTKDYVSLTGEQTKTEEVSDEEIDNEVASLQDEYTEYNKVDRGAQSGDQISLAMKVTVDGELEDDFSDSPYELILGNQEYGEEIDKKLEGVKTGDKFDYKVKYDKDDETAPFPGSTVELKGSVKEVDEVVTPELTEDFIKDKLGYDSEEDMRESIEKEITDSLTEENISTCKENLMQQVIDGSTFGDYDEDTYNEILESTEENYQSYADMFGMSLEDMLSMYGMTEDDLEEEAVNTIHRYAVVMAIFAEQGLDITDEEYQAGLESYAEQAGYDDASELESDYGEETIRFWLEDDEVLQFLYDHADIEMVEETESETVADTEG